ncbi:MAG: hypothetical protein E7318_00495 [Clostridiales bacterium]|nr:hypothetical protein [Clostridiales bacterium]
MENTPLAPRQRNRRADRQATQLPPMQQGYTPQPQAPVQQTRPMPQQVPVQPMPQVQQRYTPQPPIQPVAPAQPTRQGYIPQQGYPQSPMTMYQQPMQQQVYPQAGYQQQPVRQTQHSQVQYVNRTAVPREPMAVPQARASRSLNREVAREEKLAQREADKKARQEAKAQAEKQAEKARRAEEKAASADAKPRKAVPGWLSTAISLSLIAVCALVAAFYLMQAYLVTQENKRIAAYEAVLSNYHVTEAADGTLRVTWQEHIEKYAAQYNLQPAFVMAIIRNESSFRTNAESNVGARGLMQMMPDTAEWIADKLDDDAYTFDRMWDAETNIRYGCWYLGYLSRLFRGDAQLVSAAYHAGQTTVTQWLSDPARSSDGITLDVDRLTDGPTKQYIGRVTQTYGIYQSLLYPDEAFGAPDAVPALSSTAASPAR